MIPHGFGALTNVKHLHLMQSNDLGFQLTFQIWTGKCGGNGMMMDPYPHPQHMKVVKHLEWKWDPFHLG
jgi:hypothetical protein